MKLSSVLALIVPFFVLSCATTVPLGQISSEEAPVKPEDVAVSDIWVGAGDILNVSVYRQKDLDSKVTMPPDGVLFLPLIGEIETKGMGLRQLRQQLTNRYSKYLVEPVVSLSVESIHSRKAYVLGEVQAPGMITLDTQVDVIEAIARAGGATLDGQLGSVLVIRARGNLEKPQIKKLNIEKALNEADLTQNIEVQTGDIIFVPRAFIADVDRFFRHFANIIGPIVAWQQGVAIWPSVEGVLRGDYTSDLRKKGGSTTIVLPGGPGP